MEMSHDQYGLPDLRQLLSGRTHFPVNHPQAHEPYFVQRNMAPLGYHHDTIMVQGTSTGLVLPGGGGLARYGHDRFTTANTTSNSNNATATAVAAANGTTSMYGVEMETTTGWNVGNDGMNTRWPRQETLTLLEIRSRLDSKFKEANQKGPLWDEVSRIMAEEHGYHRSGKKCREKFENLYKYYKKTKEGKAGRQDGKHYRFFRQLEALYGDTSNQASVSETNLAQTTPLYQTSSNATNQDCLQEQKITESLSFSNTSELETSSSENNEDDLSAIAFMMNQSVEKKKRVNDQGQSCSRVRRGWKAKVKEFVESEMRKLMETQETWMERMLKTIEDREQERLCKEEEWRQQEIARFNEVQESWAKERAWVEARDASLMEVLSKFTGKVLEVSSLTDGPMTKETQGHNKNKDNHATDIPAADAGNNRNRWTEPEISSLIQLKTTMETRLIQEAGYSRRGLWEEIEAKMACLGYDRNADECKEKWESMQIYFNITTESNKKCKEDLRTGSYFLQLESYNAQQEIASQRLDNKYSPSNSFVGNQVHGPSFHILTNEGENLWDKYGKGKNHQL